jgi:hypothetical protein
VGTNSAKTIFCGLAVSWFTKRILGASRSQQQKLQFSSFSADARSHAAGSAAVWARAVGLNAQQGKERTAHSWYRSIKVGLHVLAAYTEATVGH